MRISKSVVEIEPARPARTEDRYTLTLTEEDMWTLRNAVGKSYAENAFKLHEAFKAAGFTWERANREGKAGL